MKFIPATALALALLTPLLPPTSARALEPWVEEAATARELIPPFQRTLYAGEIVRVRLQRSSALKLTMGPDSKGSVAAVVPLLKGDQTGDKKILQQEAPLILSYSPQEADCVAVRVQTGILDLEGDLAFMDERTLEAGQKTSFTIRPDTELRGRFVNVSDYRTTVFYEFRLREQPSSRAAEHDRFLTLDFRNSAREKLWSAEADEIVVEVVRGRAIVKIGQPFQRP